MLLSATQVPFGPTCATSRERGVMDGYVRGLVRIWLLLLVVWNVGCNCGPAVPLLETNTTASTTTTTDTTSDEPCGIDCAKIETPACTIAVCNTGQEIGPLNTCIVIPSAPGTACDDGKFCTTDDVCDNGTCSGGTPNKCGLGSSPCVSVVCYEESKSCDKT